MSSVQNPCVIPFHPGWLRTWFPVLGSLKSPIWGVQFPNQSSTNNHVSAISTYIPIYPNKSLYIWWCIPIWLVVDLPLWKIWISWDDDNSYIWKVKKIMFQTTNHISYIHLYAEKNPYIFLYIWWYPYIFHGFLCLKPSEMTTKKSQAASRHGRASGATTHLSKPGELEICRNHQN